MKYKITVQVKTKQGWKTRTFTQESNKSSEDLRKDIINEYDMFSLIHVDIEK